MNASVVLGHPLWIGPVHTEATAAYKRAREAGLTSARSLVVGTIASRKDGWMFRSTIAAKLGISIRTVQRAITQAKELGLMKVLLCKYEMQGKKRVYTETPPGLDGPIQNAWTHRWTIGWGMAGAAVKAAVDAARARWLVREAFKAAAPKVAQAEGGIDSKPRGAAARTEYQSRERVRALRAQHGDNWIEIELDRLERERKPPD